MRSLAVLVVIVAACGSTSSSSVPPPQKEPPPENAAEPLPGIDATQFLTKESFRPELAPNAPPGLLDKVTFESIRLLDRDIAKRVPPDALRAFLELCIRSTISSLGVSKKPIEVRIHYTTDDGKNTIRLDTKGSPDAQLLGWIHQDLGGMPPLGLTGEIAVQIHVKVSGGSSEPWVVGQPLAAPPVEGVYVPAKDLPADPPTQKAKMLYVRLVTPGDQLAARTTPEALLAFIEAVQAHAEATIGTTSTSSFELTLEMHCTPQGHTMQIGFVGSVDASFVKAAQALTDAVKAMPKLQTTGDVDFVIGLDVN